VALQPFVGPWTSDQPVARPLPAHRATQTQNKRIHTSMSRVGFERTIPVFERGKTVHDLDRAATVIGPKSKLISVKLIEKVLAFCESLLYVQEPGHM
jgi:hypothetical protein